MREKFQKMVGKWKFFRTSKRNIWAIRKCILGSLGPFGRSEIQKMWFFYAQMTLIHEYPPCLPTCVIWCFKSRMCKMLKSDVMTEKSLFLFQKVFWKCFGLLKTIFVTLEVIFLAKMQFENFEFCKKSQKLAFLSHFWHIHQPLRGGEGR